MTVLWDSGSLQNEALPLAIAREFLLKRPKNFRRDGFQLEIRLIDDAAAAFDAIAALSLEPIG